MINIADAMKLKPLITKFTQNHPKVPMFFSAVGSQVTEGATIEVNVTTADGKNLCTNMRVTQDDLELLAALKKLA